MTTEFVRNLKLINVSVIVLSSLYQELSRDVQRSIKVQRRIS
jgi:hypothetical protein